MVLTLIFVIVVFLYSLVSRRLERTIVTAPIIFTAAGFFIFLLPPQLQTLRLVKPLGGNPSALSRSVGARPPVRP
jgi:hypothetical protein